VSGDLKKFGTVALVSCEKPETVGFMNVYDTGDVWVKVRGCEVCSQHCCGKCPLQFEGKCRVHQTDPQNKPYVCVVQPLPNVQRLNCALVWKCFSGILEGRHRWACDPQNIYRYEGP
jgi:hypothetical protein